MVLEAELYCYIKVLFRKPRVPWSTTINTIIRTIFKTMSCSTKCQWAWAWIAFCIMEWNLYISITTCYTAITSAAHFTEQSQDLMGFVGSGPNVCAISWPCFRCEVNRKCIHRCPPHVRGFRFSTECALKMSDGEDVSCNQYFWRLNWCLIPCCFAHRFYCTFWHFVFRVVELYVNWKAFYMESLGISYVYLFKHLSKNKCSLFLYDVGI